MHSVALDFRERFLPLLECTHREGTSCMTTPAVRISVEFEEKRTCKPRHILADKLTRVGRVAIRIPL